MRRGFSLVELSIVLVILGLLTGGILAGQSLIRASELRAVSTEYGRWRTATSSFRDKYFAAPGDMTNATKFWGQSTNCGGAVAAGTCDGNGSGVVNIGAAGANSPSEVFAFWQQLALAGLIEGSYNGLSGPLGAFDANLSTNAPRSKLGNGGWSLNAQGTSLISSPNLFEGDYTQYYDFGGQLGGTTTWNAILRPEEAWNIDTKVDDGRPGLGLVRVREDLTGCHTAGSSTSVALASTAQYALSTNSMQCALMFMY